MTDMLEGFNPAQRAAVEFCDGPSLVIAGAGSGKTRVLTYKIAYLLDHGFQPWSILALTFTNKAAGEMKQRIAKIVGEENARHLWMGTFHSIFLRILRTEHEAIGFSSNFTIYDSADSKSLMKAIIKEMALDDKTYKPSTILSHISNAKNHLVTAEEYIGNVANAQADARSKIPALGDIYLRYSTRCKQADAMDFDDILVYTYRLFEEHEEIRQKYAERFRFVLVDEYQDTNFAQHRIVWQLTKENQKVCVVGDDAQSIYSFRGANIDNILTFRDAYSGSKLFKLEQNYRSTQTIVNAANSLICKNNRQIKKDIFSEKEVGEKIKVSEAFSDVEEGQIVVRQIRQIRQAERCEYSDFAILYRTNAQSRIFEEELRKNGFPYKIYGGLSFYQRKEIKDVIAYFRLATNPNDEEALKRVINYPARGIGNTTIQKIVNAANIYGVSLWSVVECPDKYGVNINKGTYSKLQDFHSLIEQFMELARTQDAENAGKEIIQRSGIIADIYQDATPENLARQENIEELVNGFSDFCSSRLEEGNRNIYITDYLSEVSLLSDVDTDKGDEEHKITLMTIHSAKGLEFPTVFIVGMEENLFPSQLSSGSPKEMEEERRLFYVALTRAEKHCFLSYAKSRYRYGSMEFGSPSRFLDDIDQQYLDRGRSIRAAKTRTSYDDVDLPWKKRPAFPEYQQRPTPRPQVMQQQNVAPPLPSMHRIQSSPQSAQPVSSVSTSAGTIVVGCRVVHQRFGQGTVTKLEGQGENLKATVQFDNSGVRQLLLKFAKLSVI